MLCYKRGNALNKYSIFVVIFIFLVQGYVFASNNVTFKTTNNITTFYYNGKIVGTYRTRNMTNGYVETETCYDGSCQYDVMSPMMSKKNIYNVQSAIQNRCNLYKNLQTQMQYEQRQQQIKQANKSIIVKKVSITTNKGENISLIEDKNGDDFLLINGKSINKIGIGLATSKDKWVYEIIPDNYNFENAMNIEESKNVWNSPKKSYEEMVYTSNYLGDLFKVVYRLRVEHGVSYQDAQKLMTFGIDNRHYKPTDLLLRSEKQAIKYKQNTEKTKETLKNAAFPKY